MEKGYALTSKKYRSVYEIVATETPGIIKHMKKILRYSQKDGGCLEQERDVWESSPQQPDKECKDYKF